MLRPKLKLEGKCNRCGLCCYVGGLKCKNLDVIGIAGMPGASFCKAYRIRYPGMPIILVNANGAPVAMGACTHGSDMDAEVIAPHIGHGCSLTIARS